MYANRRARRGCGGWIPRPFALPLDYLRADGKWSNYGDLSGRWKKALHHSVDWFLNFTIFFLFFSFSLIPFLVVFHVYRSWRAGLVGLQAHIIGAVQHARQLPV